MFVFRAFFLMTSFCFPLLALPPFQHLEQSTSRAIAEPPELGQNHNTYSALDSLRDTVCDVSISPFCVVGLFLLCENGLILNQSTRDIVTYSLFLLAFARIGHAYYTHRFQDLQGEENP